MRCVARAIVIALLAAGCVGESPSSDPVSPPPSAAATTAAASIPDLPSATIEATPGFSPGATPVAGSATFQGLPADLWFAGSIAMRVDVAELNIRAGPSTSAAKRGLAQKGDVIVVYEAAREADGYQWFFGFVAIHGAGKLPQLPAPIPPAIDPPEGWFATPAGGTSYLIRLDARCTATPDVASIAAMLDSERVACFGSRLLTLEGPLGCIDCGGTGQVWEPEWLANTFRDPVIRAGDSQLQLYFPPDVDGGDEVGNIVRVTGRFDDPRSGGCRIELETDQGTTIRIPDSVAIEYCRRHFVVESLTILGPDPSYVGI